MMTNKTKIIQDYLNEILPEAKCFLNYTKPYELVLAVMLSAQTTDVKVNSVTKILFKKYRSITDYIIADYKDVYNIIKPLGLAKTKAQNIIDICKILHEKFNDEVPLKKEELIKLPGVGNKTAAVVRIELYKEPDFPVDTHIKRISYRLKFTDKNKLPDYISSVLKKEFPKDNWIKLHHQLIWFGRTVCLARNPHCGQCKLSKFCVDFNKKN